MTIFFSSDLAVLGCNVSDKTIEDVKRVFHIISEALNISTETAMNNVSPVNARSHIMKAPPRICVLVVDAATVYDAYEQLPKRRVEYEDLLTTAANTVGKMVIVPLKSFSNSFLPGA